MHPGRRWINMLGRAAAMRLQRQAHAVDDFAGRHPAAGSVSVKPARLRGLIPAAFGETVPSEMGERRNKRGNSD
jgi:hypothetical protein